MARTCPACQGSGECQYEDFHDQDVVGRVLTNYACPACGNYLHQGRGNCSTCGGSGELDD